MKIKLNKEYTAKWQEEAIKEKMKEFKQRFTPDELLLMWREATGKRVVGEVLKAEIEAFASNYYDYSMSVSCELTVFEKYMVVDHIRFYVEEIEGEYRINMTDALLTHDRYTRER